VWASLANHQQGQATKTLRKVQVDSLESRQDENGAKAKGPKK
jgi:hypothetical protein